MMKVPVPPPASLRELLKGLTSQGRLSEVLVEPGLARDPDYHPWEWFFRHQPPEGFSNREWWVAVRAARAATARATPFTLVDGHPITYNLPDMLLQMVDEVSARARGTIMAEQPVLGEASRERYLLTSLREEAITSSQLEGASTTRVQAKRMMQEGRAPQTRGERMILNNLRAMEFVLEHKEEPLTPQMVLRVHEIVTEGTLDDPADCGRMQRAGEERVRIYGGYDDGQVLHVPPPSEQLEDRLHALCAFANGEEAGGGYVPPLVRAIVIHFMAAYDHYFVDGNGRTARALFYWSMLHQGFFMAEYLSISRLLRRAPARYARSFLHAEQDEGDLTYFLLEQARVIVRALEDLQAHLEDKSAQMRQMAQGLRASGLNHRQIAVLERFVRDPGAVATVSEHARAFGVVLQTARTDLRVLEDLGLLGSVRQGRRVVWFPVGDLPARLARFGRAG